MKLYSVQLDIQWEDKAANRARVRELLRAAAPAPGSLIVLPEMFSTGFSMNLSATLRESREDEQFLADRAREYRSCVIGGLVNEGEGGMGRNEALAFDAEGRLLARYTKMHPFSLAGEKEVHTAGEDVTTFAWGGFTVAPFVCYDLRFPEIFRPAVQRGAHLLVVIALWPSRRQQHWLTLLQARAIENQAYVIGVNRTGNEPQYQYAGRSVVVDPQGVIIADAGDRETVLPSEIQPEIVEAWRRDFPALRDARF